jgi:predicted transposase/invertase (TIGR01784 family)
MSLKRKFWNANPLADRVFAAIFTSLDVASQEALDSLASAILGFTVKNVAVQNPVLTIEAEGQKRPVADILCTLEDGSLFTLEVQTEKEDDLCFRQLYYWSRLYDRSLKEGKNQTYGTLRSVYQVVILCRGTMYPWPECKTESAITVLHHDVLFEPCHLHLIMIELEKVEKDDTLSCILKAWLLYLKEGWKDKKRAKALGKEVPGIARALEVGMALAMKKDYELIPREMHGIDLMNARVKGEQLGLKKGEQIGVKKGELLGVKKGEKVGLKKGEKIGVKKALLQVARNLKASGSPIEFIAKQTGLSLEEINDL